MCRRPFCPIALALLFGIHVPTVHAHGVKAGDLAIDHPYATPTRPGMTTGAVYFRAIRNDGTEPDRLLSARTPVAASVELHRMEMDGDVMRMRAVSAIELPAKTEVRLRHSMANGHHLMLLGLKAPMKDGDRFAVTLSFQRAGEREVMVWVQTPRGGDDMHSRDH
jgi:hypothetical protein